jgi:acyl carrier protein
MSAAEKEELKKRIKEVLVEALNIEHVSPQEIGDDEVLFAKDNKLGLDSIDAIEIVVAVQREFGVRISDQTSSRVVLESVNTLADYIEKEQAKQ